MLSLATHALAAENFSVDGLQYSIEDGVVSVADNTAATGDIIIPSSVNYQGTDYEVTAIAEWAFQWSSITSVTFPETIISIGDNAFSGTQISTLNLPSSVKKLGMWAFSNCPNLTEVSVPENATDLGYGAFQGCDNLTTIIVPGTIKEIPEQFVANCWNLTNIWLSEGIEKIGDYAFSGGNCQVTDFYIPSTVKWIGNGILQGAQLTSLTIPASVTHIGDYAFAYCYNQAFTELRFEDGEETLELGSYPFSSLPVKSIYLGRNLSTALDADTYNLKELTTGGGCKRVDGFSSGCYSMEKLNLHEGLEVIGKGTFSMLDNVKHVTIPASVATIEEGAFSILQNLDDFTFADSETPLTVQDYCFSSCDPKRCYVGREIDGNGFYMGVWSIEELSFGGGCKTIKTYWSSKSSLKVVNIGEGVTTIEKQGLYNCGELKYVYTPSTLTYIGEGAFSYCPKLETFHIPDAVTYIGDSAFGDTQISEVNLPEGLTYLGGWSFAGCKNITSVKIPSTLEEIQWCTFKDCTGITSVTIPANVKFIDTQAFGSCTSLTDITIADSDEALRLSSMGVFIGSPVVNLYLGRQIHGSHFTTTDLANLEFGGSCTQAIGFDEATALKSVTFGLAVTDIATKCFAKAGNIAKVQSAATVPPALAENAFATKVYENSVLTVPAPSAMDYEGSASWSLFAHIPGVRYDLTINATEGGGVSVGNTEDTSCPVLMSRAIDIESAIAKSATPTVTVTADNGYDIASVSVNGEPVEISGLSGFSFTLPPMRASMVIDVVFERNEFSVTVNHNVGGKVIADGVEIDGMTVAKGATFTATAMPDEGYRVAAVTLNGEPYAFNDEGAVTLTLDKVSDDSTFEVVFSPMSGIATPDADSNAIEVEGLTVSIPGYDGTMGVYTLSGAVIYNGPGRPVTVPVSGIYIVKTATSATKVTVR